MPSRTKMCKDCGKTFPIEEFPFTDKLHLYRSSRCRDCHNFNQRKRWHDSRGRDGSKALPGWGRSEYQKRRQEEKKRRNRIPGMRECTNCGELKPIEEFVFRNKAKGERTAQCGDCLREYKNQAYRKHTEKYKDRERKSRKVAIRRTKALAWAWLETHPCVDCGEEDAILLDFDRPKGRGCDGVPSMGAAHKSKEYVLEALQKWPVRCANCLEQKHFEKSWKFIPAMESSK